jgi:hypothetical protein
MNERSIEQRQRTVEAVSNGLLQRKCDCGQHTVAGGECDECGKKHVSRQRAHRNSELGTLNSGDVPPIVHEVLNSSGQPLDASTRAFFEPRFGHDFSRVRVHADPRAAESARAVNALAYTVGRDVVFGKGQYAPGTRGGLGTLAHELAHFLQQGGSSQTVQPKKQPGVASDGNEPQGEQVAGQAEYSGGTLSIGQPGDSYEREADSAAEAVMSTGEPRVSSNDAASGLVRRLTAPLLQRRLVVNPTDTVPMPAGQSGPADLLTHAVQGLLADTCRDGGFQVNATTGVVTPGSNTFCTSHAPYVPGVTEADVSSTPVGCKCICDLIGSGRTATVAFHAGGPGTSPGAVPGAGPGQGGVPTDPTAFVDPGFQGQYLINGKWVDIPFHLIFAHELCGHALPDMRGTHSPRSGVVPPGGTPDAEVHAVDVERQIAAEHNPPLPRRPENYGGAARERP